MQKTNLKRLSNYIKEVDVINRDLKVRNLKGVSIQKQLMPEYLMMWFSRSKFDRQAAYYAVGGEMIWCEELGKEIFVGWRMGVLGEYETVIFGFAFKSDWWQNQGIPVIKIGNIKDQRVDINNCDCHDWCNAR